MRELDLEKGMHIKSKSEPLKRKNCGMHILRVSWTERGTNMWVLDKAEVSVIS